MRTKITKSRRKSPRLRQSADAPLSRDQIIAHALKLSRTVPLQEISIKRIASDLGVTRGSIHYHLKLREDLIAAVFNQFQREMMASWPTMTGSWRSDLKAISIMMYGHFLRYAGVSAYFAVQNRFRLVLPALEQDETGAVLEFYERLFGAVGAVGLDAHRSATYASLLIQFAHNSAHHTAAHQWPGEQRKLATYFDKVDASQFPNIATMRKSYVHLAGDMAFETGLGLLLAGLEKERER
jgi:AcrR family transcriptional regulator